MCNYINYIYNLVLNEEPNALNNTIIFLQLKPFTRANSKSSLVKKPTTEQKCGRSVMNIQLGQASTGVVVQILNGNKGIIMQRLCSYSEYVLVAKTKSRLHMRWIRVAFGALTPNFRCSSGYHRLSEEQPTSHWKSSFNIYCYLWICMNFTELRMNFKILEKRNDALACVYM